MSSTYVSLIFCLSFLCSYDCRTMESSQAAAPNTKGPKDAKETTCIIPDLFKSMQALNQDLLMLAQYLGTWRCKCHKGDTTGQTQCMPSAEFKSLMSAGWESLIQYLLRTKVTAKNDQQEADTGTSSDDSSGEESDSESESDSSSSSSNTNSDTEDAEGDADLEEEIDIHVDMDSTMEDHTGSPGPLQVRVHDSLLVTTTSQANTDDKGITREVKVTRSKEVTNKKDVPVEDLMDPDSRAARFARDPIQLEALLDETRKTKERSPRCARPKSAMAFSTLDTSHGHQYDRRGQQEQRASRPRPPSRGQNPVKNWRSNTSGLHPKYQFKSEKTMVPKADESRYPETSNNSPGNTISQNHHGRGNGPRYQSTTQNGWRQDTRSGTRYRCDRVPPTLGRSRTPQRHSRSPRRSDNRAESRRKRSHSPDQSLARKQPRREEQARRKRSVSPSQSPARTRRTQEYNSRTVALMSPAELRAAMKTMEEALRRTSNGLPSSRT